jgi:hypothetical protein
LMEVPSGVLHQQDFTSARSLPRIRRNRNARSVSARTMPKRKR